MTLGAALAAFSLPAFPARADEAGECGMMCRLGAYISADHMTEAVPSPAVPAAPRPHRRAAATQAPARKAAIASPAPRPAARVAPRSAAMPSPADRDPASNRKPAVVKNVAGETRAVHPAAPPQAAPRPAAARVAIADPPKVKPPAARRPGSAARTAVVWSVIPGSAPAVQAGFH